MTSPQDDTDTRDSYVLLNEAVQKQQAGDLDGAAALFDKLIQRHPGNVQLYEVAAQIEMARGDGAAAIGHLRCVVELSPPHAEAWRQMGILLAEQGYSDQALACIDVAANLQPDNAEVQYNRATLLLRQNRPQEALDGFDRTLSLRPDYVEAVINRAIANQSLNRRQDALADYRRACTLAPDNIEVRFEYGNLAMAEGHFDDALAAYDAVLQRSPDSSPAHNNRAEALRALGRTDEALAGFTAAANADPSNAQAWNNLARLLAASLRPREAIPFFDRALALTPDFAEAYSGRGRAYLALDCPQKALSDFEAAARLIPNNAEYVSNTGSAFLAQNRLNEALGAFETALQLAPSDPVHVWNKALTLLTMGDFAQGWPLYESRWQRGGMQNHVRTFSAPRWTGAEALAGKTIFVYAEQGLGDTIQFARYLPLLAAGGARVVFEAPATLHPLLATLKGDIRLCTPGQTPPPFDCYSALMSLPLAFAPTRIEPPADVPYLHADPERCARWQAKLGAHTKPRIGLTVAGRAQHENDRNRSFPLETLRPLLDGPYEFHLLQNEIRDGDRQALAADAAIKTYTDELTDFGETAALAAQMDAVVSVDTAAAHLAGAMGIATILLLPFAADWRWMAGRADSPWYPSMHLIRQSAIGERSAVADEARKCLDAVLTGKR